MKLRRFFVGGAINQSVFFDSPIILSIEFKITLIVRTTNIMLCQHCRYVRLSHIIPCQPTLQLHSKVRLQKPLTHPGMQTHFSQNWPLLKRFESLKNTSLIPEMSMIDLLIMIVLKDIILANNDRIDKYHSG
jgi:hypothetical protein